MITERKMYGGRGQGTLLKYDSSPFWYSVLRVRGKEVCESTKTEDLKVARRVHKNRLDAVALDRQGVKPFAAPMAQRVTVSELLDAWLQDVDLRGLKSAKSYQYHQRASREKFGDWRAVDVTAEAVDSWVTKLRADGLAAATCNRRVQCLASSFKLAVERKRLTSAPTFRKLSEAGNARQGFFEQDEVDRLIPVLPEHLQDATQFAYFTSWRKEEVFGLRWEWVDLAGRTITLPTTKNGKRRSLRLGGEVLEILKRREAARLTERDGQPVVSDYVFHRRGQRVIDFKRVWRSAVKAAGLPHKMFHDLRRSGVRNMIRKGVPETVAMSISGHRTRSTFDRYSITSGADQVAAMEAVSVGQDGQTPARD
jgi:integrase